MRFTTASTIFWTPSYTWHRIEQVTYPGFNKAVFRSRTAMFKAAPGRFFGRLEPRAKATFYKAVPAASFRKAKYQSFFLVLITLFFAWSRSRLIWSESAPGPRTSGAAQKMVKNEHVGGGGVEKNKINVQPLVSFIPPKTRSVFESEKCPSPGRRWPRTWRRGWWPACCPGPHKPRPPHTPPPATHSPC